jgi:2-polyprenyl-6-methoxyphenol hydroxylase-like FAD-dependent oxidoreductase
MVSLASRIRIVGGGISGISCLGFLKCAGFKDVKLFNSSKANAASRHIMADDYALGLWSPSLSALRQLSPLIPEKWIRKGFGAYLGKSGYKSVDGSWIIQSTENDIIMSDLLLFGSYHALLEILKETDDLKEFIYEDKMLNSLKEDDEGVILNFDDGSSETADCVIGADGIFSRIRSHTSLSSPNLSPVYRDYIVFRGYAIGDRFPYSEYGFQTWGAGKRFASVPLANSQTWYATIKVKQDDPVFSDLLKVSEKNDHQNRLMKLKGFLLEHFQNWHYPISRLIEDTSENMISAQPALALPPECWRAFSTPKCSLIGDACHGLDPILAQGAGIGIEDAAELVHEMKISIDQKAVDFREAFQRYEDKRIGRMKILHNISNLNQSFGMINSPILVKLRDSILKALPTRTKAQLFDYLVKMSLSDDGSILSDPFKPVTIYEPSSVRVRLTSPIE